MFPTQGRRIHEARVGQGPYCEVLAQPVTDCVTDPLSSLDLVGEHRRHGWKVCKEDMYLFTL